MCKFDDDGPNETFKFYSCDRPKFVKDICVTEGYEDSKEPSLLAEIDCNICNLPTKIIGRVNYYKKVDSENDFDFYYWPTYIADAKATATLDSIKLACKNYPDFDLRVGDISPLIHLNTILDYQNNGHDDQLTLPINFPVKENQKTCTHDVENGLSEEEKEVNDYLKALEEPVETSKGPTSPFKAFGYLDGPLNTLGLPNLKHVWYYETSNEEQNKDVESQIGLKLNSQDIKSRINHLVFDDPAPSIETIQETLKEKVKQYRYSLKSIIKAYCEKDKEDHLNVSIKREANPPPTLRFKINCTKDDAGIKHITFEPIK